MGPLWGPVPAGDRALCLTLPGGAWFGLGPLPAGLRSGTDSEDLHGTLCTVLAMQPGPRTGAALVMSTRMGARCTDTRLACLLALSRLLSHSISDLPESETTLAHPVPASMIPGEFLPPSLADGGSQPVPWALLGCPHWGWGCVRGTQYPWGMAHEPEGCKGAA